MYICALIFHSCRNIKIYTYAYIHVRLIYIYIFFLREFMFATGLQIYVLSTDVLAGGSFGTSASCSPRFTRPAGIHVASPGKPESPLSV